MKNVIRKLIHLKRISLSIIISLFLAGVFVPNTQAQNEDPYQNFGQNFPEKINQPPYTIPSGPYQPNWKSLYKHTAVPTWFRDAKFGIYAHWGVYSVPAYGSEWYPRNMYNKKGDVYKHHLKTYGSPSKFGYPDFVPMFKAQKFNADKWAKLFKAAGARFAGPVAEHHDGFAMWNSDWTPWNAMDKGPHQDVVGELEKAIRKQGMKFVTSFHHARNNLWKKDGKWTGHYSYVKKYFPSLLNDPERAIMYGNIPRRTFLEMWRGELEEVIHKYHPDLMWFDSWLDDIPDSVKADYLAYYFNDASQRNKKVVVTAKQKDLPPEVGVKDFEKGRAGSILDDPFLTDDTISNGSWSFTKGLQIKSASVVLHSLIDIVSKNGQLLLNISPKADGTIPENQRKVLLDIGQWLSINGEAIYGTRPWYTYGEGPTKLKKGRFGGFTDAGGYTARDVRYTTKENTIYAILLGWPGAGKTVMLNAWDKSKLSSDIDIQDVSMLGSDESLDWDWQEKGLIITTPSHAPDTKAVVFKIVTKNN